MKVVAYTDAPSDDARRRVVRRMISAWAVVCEELAKNGIEETTTKCARRKKPTY